MVAQEYPPNYIISVISLINHIFDDIRPGIVSISIKASVLSIPEALLLSILIYSVEKVAPVCVEIDYALGLTKESIQVLLLRG